MTSKTWIGGHANNAAGAGANWSPHGAPKPGDDLTMVTGTINIGGRLKGDTLHLNDPRAGIGSVTVNLTGGADTSIDGSLAGANPLIINAFGTDFLDVKGFAAGSSQRGGTINLVGNAHLYISGDMQFGYGGLLTGGQGSVLTNNGTLHLGSSTYGPTTGVISTRVDGTGELDFRGYHSSPGTAYINAPIGQGQTVDLNPANYGLTMYLNDPGDFHGMLKLDPYANNPYSPGRASVVVGGVHADRAFAISADRVMLTDQGQTVDLLRVQNAGSMQISATDSPTGTTLNFVVPH